MNRWICVVLMLTLCLLPVLAFSAQELDAEGQALPELVGQSRLIKWLSIAVCGSGVIGLMIAWALDKAREEENHRRRRARRSRHI